jgi:CRP/FNR family cyclic AMP-dependent transcriptional regulator
MTMEQLTSPALYLGLALILIILGLAMKNMLPLRIFTLLSTLLFLAYAFLQTNTVLIIAGLFALIVGGYRLFEVQNTSRKIRRVRHYGYEIEKLLPIMAEIELPAGQVIFTKGDPADRLFVPTEGTVEIVENGAHIKAGELLGEIGLFTGMGTRTMTARCLTECKIRTMTAYEVDNLYFTQPEFALALVKIMATRMTENVQRLEQKLAEK